MATAILPSPSPGAMNQNSSASFYEAEYTPTPTSTSAIKSTTTPTTTSSSSQQQQSSMLSSKITASLTYEGYDHHSVQKVKGLVGKNTLFSKFVNTDTNLKNIEGEIKNVIGDMIQSGKNNGLYVNSNEVVLMLEVKDLEGKTREEVEGFKEAVLDILGREFCIWPVRVYIVKSVSGSEEGNDIDGIRVVLLNVVNTDIGSPSMVSLLEHDCALKTTVAKEWEERIVLIEAWGQRNLLWRDEKSWKAVDDGFVDVAVEEKKAPQIEQRELVHEFEHVTLTVTRDLEVEAEVESDVESSSGSLVDVSKPEGSISEDEHDEETSDEGSAKIAEHPAVAELAAREAARGHIQHPTWQHVEESTSLIDLVKMHASRTAVTDDAGEVEQSDQDPKAGNEVGFEMV